MIDIGDALKMVAIAGIIFVGAHLAVFVVQVMEENHTLTTTNSELVYYATVKVDSLRAENAYLESFKDGAIAAVDAGEFVEYVRLMAGEAER